MDGKRKRGRPRVYSETKQCIFRITEGDQALIDEMSGILGMSKSEIFRQALRFYYEKMMLY